MLDDINLDISDFQGDNLWIQIYEMVEAAGIEPASVNPPRTGDYMLSLSLI